LLRFKPRSLAISVLQNVRASAVRFLLRRHDWLVVAAREQNWQALFSRVLFLHGQSCLARGLCKMLSRRSFGKVVTAASKGAVSGVVAIVMEDFRVLLGSYKSGGGFSSRNSRGQR
jgi:hypothetical protein